MDNQNAVEEAALASGAPQRIAADALITRARNTSPASAWFGIVVGDLVALDAVTSTGYVRHAGQIGSAAVAARSVVELRARHIGAPVVLAFEGGDPRRPIVMGVLLMPSEQTPAELPTTVQVEVDEGRTIIAASHQLVLRCGQASITLTNAGKILIQGQHVQSVATGVNRVLGGSVEIN